MSALDAKVAAARALGRLARTAGRGGGTSLPGKVLTRLEPDAIARLAARLSQGSVVISATNGKTTSAAMAAAVLQHAGHRLVYNRAGANLASGIASTLADASGRGGRIDGQLGLFEVDEFWLDTVAPALAPRVMLLGNLFRDQLDRYGELETIADRWAAMVAALPATTTLALNADDPLIADLGSGRDGVLYFGVQDRSLATPEMQHAADSTHCRRCGAAYVYDAVYLGHLGVYRCPHCDGHRPEPSVSAVNVRLRGTDSAAFELVTPAGTVAVSLPLPGLYNVYNALGRPGVRAR
jgi:UDP-N-acetylmuramyl tripeptide synthase